MSIESHRSTDTYSILPTFYLLIHIELPLYDDMVPQNAFPYKGDRRA